MKKQHYFLISGLVIFHTKDGDPGQVMLNGIVASDSRNVPARLIGKAQQVLQLNFFKKIEDATVTVVDVPIYSISHLGLMTEKDFHAAPEGMKLAERAGNNPFADPDQPKVTDTAKPTVN